jgi:DNA-damage-inducible protein D
MPDGRALADFLPTITIKAKDFASEITNFNIKRDDLRHEGTITDEHVKNNLDVRNVLTDRVSSRKSCRLPKISRNWSAG